eukprot:scaffold22346_cov54-Phaeocystis_antarctica.AAC.1
MARITGARLSLRTTVQAVPATYRSPGARQYGTHALDRVQHKPEAYYDLIDKEATLLGATAELGAISGTGTLTPNP